MSSEAPRLTGHEDQTTRAAWKRVMEEFRIRDFGSTESVWLTWGDDWNHDDYVINLTEALAKHGLAITRAGVAS